MPRIIDSPGLGKHCHSCGVWMARRALRKESTCPSCKKHIIARERQIYCIASRCVECDSITLDGFMNCETCGLETANGLKRKNKIEKAKQLSALAKRKQQSYQDDISSSYSKECSILSEDSFIEEFSLSKIELPSYGKYFYCCLN